ncbi:hypothetical protein CDD80_4376 [Ophiocordyceps camponoti-rufipedis]|uniref:Uncharacterized protein n=1 Tax=Ophiocordyceps camponoti-rufipedis TaxID=2004952 RepID=A0A2C5Z0J9_9HYPO|nr:hypothetical protein CDD80_4376 [Ophiocordyceps camponoti-rufipedis]
MEAEPASFLPRPLRIIVIGAGISGIQFARDVSTRLTNVELCIYDKNKEEGGTWAENRYPGWNPNPEWTRPHAQAAEILRYLKSTVKKHNLGQYFRFNVRCTGAVWLQDENVWNVTLETVDEPCTTFEEHCDVFVSALGRTNNWKLPDIPGLSRFTGPVLHTANWPPGFDCRGKDVAIIGNGASALQCLAAIEQGCFVI